MLENYTDITVILDRSYSMKRLQDEVIGGFNSFMEEQKKVEGKCTVSLIQFDDQYELNYEGLLLESVPALNRETYIPRGMTAMYDAIGRGIFATGERLKGLSEDQRPEKVIFVIQTDGEENCSQEFTADNIKKMIQVQESKFSWDFTFLGANINAKLTAVNIGIQANKAMKFANNVDGTIQAFASLSRGITAVREKTKVGMSYGDVDYANQLNAGVSQ